jgi:hypothetical protein
MTSVLAVRCVRFRLQNDPVTRFEHERDAIQHATRDMAMPFDRDICPVSYEGARNTKLNFFLPSP